jgi:hypothetical protein
MEQQRAAPSEEDLIPPSPPPVPATGFPDVQPETRRSARERKPVASYSTFAGYDDGEEDEDGQDAFSHQKKKKKGPVAKGNKPSKKQKKKVDDDDDDAFD